MKSLDFFYVYAKTENNNWLIKVFELEFCIWIELKMVSNELEL